jgi:carbamoyltransferase
VADTGRGYRGNGPYDSAPALVAGPTLDATGSTQVPAILGLNCFSHDTSAALLVDGRVVAIGEEERFNRQVHTRAFPDGAIEFCLRQAGLQMSDLTAVAVAQRPLVDLGRGVRDAVTRVAPKRLAAQVYTDAALLAKERYFRRRWGYRGRLVHVGHHEAHAASAFFSSPFDQAAVLTLDRGGDYLSTTMSIGEGDRLRNVWSTRNPHSLGEVYTALTWFLGFRPNSDEGKVMGLAPYGTDRYVPEFRDFLRLRAEGRFEVNFRWFGYQRDRTLVSRRFRRRYGQPRPPESELTQRDKDLAFAVQALIEDAGLHVARELRRRSPSSNLCLAGGVALNSVMNYRLLTEAGFDEAFIQPAASDAGNALGAALWVHHQVLGQPRDWQMTHPFWGPSFEDHALVGALRDAGLDFREVADPVAEAARLVAGGNVVGWFQGRAEIGPRALGARSILADPRKAESRDIVNERVKRREWFRPFAPSILHERGPDYFVGYRPNHFMLLVEPIRADRREEIPAVTHVDGSGRLQSVTEEFNADYHRLIREFDRLTGVPVVLNTSFNVRGEPIVNLPAQAVADFVGSEMDALVMGRYVTLKPGR